MSLSNKVRNYVLKHADQFDVVLWLDSSEHVGKSHIGKYKILVGLGSKSSIVLNEANPSDWQVIDDFCARTVWKFTTVSYDLKNPLHGLKTTNPDTHNWPLLEIHEPEVVIGVDYDDNLFVEGMNRDEIRSSIEHESDSYDAKVKVQVKVEEISSAVSRDEYHESVAYIKQQIREGNMYEMNLCVEHELMHPDIPDPLALFQELNTVSPTPFAAFVKSNNRNVLCASPERFLRRSNDVLYSQPIKGTSERLEDVVANNQSKLHLANSIKERAEHVMIVDLVRNDLSRVCTPGSVQVEELFGIYEFRQVNQMISTISGKQEAGTTFTDILRATFPMGSMTGAPKRIVMEFIDEIETTSRGWYSGSIGYIEPNGNFDLNVVIRSLLIDTETNKSSYTVGGAITFDSDPEAEFHECKLKAKAINKILGF